MVFDAEPIPDQEEMFAHLVKAKCFIKIDLSKRYWQISVKPEDRHKKAFQELAGSFSVDLHAFRSCFRSRNVCADDANTVFDDILIATEDLCCRIHCLRQVLSKLQRFGLTARPSSSMPVFKSCSSLVI